MTIRTSKAHLNGMLGRIQRSLNAPTGKLWTTDAKGQNRATVGAIFIEEGSRTYGRQWKVCRMVNEAGGESVLLSAPTASDLYEKMYAWLAGFEAMRDITS